MWNFCIWKMLTNVSSLYICMPFRKCACLRTILSFYHITYSLHLFLCFNPQISNKLGIWGFMAVLPSFLVWESDSGERHLNDQCQEPKLSVDANCFMQFCYNTDLFSWGVGHTKRIEGIWTFGSWSVSLEFRALVVWRLTSLPSWLYKVCGVPNCCMLNKFVCRWLLIFAWG